MHLHHIQVPQEQRVIGGKVRMDVRKDKQNYVKKIHNYAMAVGKSPTPKICIVPVINFQAPHLLV